MAKTFDKVISGNHQYKIGVYFGIAIALLALTTQIKTILFEFPTSFDWLFVFLIGITIFFFFMGIGLNTEENTFIKETPDDKGNVSRNTQTSFNTFLRRFNILSKSCFWFSGIFLFLAIIRLGFIIWK